jgi:CBS-domain-containing membrane protein
MLMLKAKDIMTTHVVTVNRDDTIDHAISLMVKHRISGLPVIDQDHRPLGIISEFDLLELICEGQDEEYSVTEFMSPRLFGVEEDDSWVDIADSFREKHVRRLPVLKDDKLVGIITRHDLMHAIRDARRQMRICLDHDCTTHREDAACGQAAEPVDMSLPEPTK